MPTAIPSTGIPAIKPSTTSHDFYNFQLVTRLQLPLREFRWGHCLTVVLHHHTARQQFLRGQKRLNRAWQLRFDRFSVGDDK